MTHGGIAALICSLMIGLADERADYEELCAIWRKTEPEAGRPKGVVTDAERRLLLEELGGRREGIAPHDFRRMAAITLGNLRAEGAVPGLIARLVDIEDDPMVSAEAARALGKIGDVRALPHLLDAFEDDRPSVRRHAAQALRTLDPGPKAVRPFATAERFRRLLEGLDRIPLPSSEREWLESDSTASNRSYAAAREVDAVCVGLNLARPEPLAAGDREQAARRAEALLRAGFPAFAYKLDSLPDLARFCRDFRPALYTERVGGPEP